MKISALKWTVITFFLICLTSIASNDAFGQLLSSELSPSETSTGPYSSEVQELIETTYLGHAAQFPDPGEPAVVLKKILETKGHGTKTTEQELDRQIFEWEALFREYPESRHAHVGLARLYWEKADLTGDTALLQITTDLFRQASDIGLKHGRILYTLELSELFVRLDDKEQLVKTFEHILSIPEERMDPGQYYLVLVHYAEGLVKFHDDAQAFAIFDSAIEFFPENNIEAINRYTGYLLERGEYQKTIEILDSLTTERRVWEVTPSIHRHKALTMLGLDTSSADNELHMIEEHLTVSGPGPKFGVLGPYVVAQSDDVSTATPAATESHSHDNQTDDCRSAPINAVLCPCAAQPALFPTCPGCTFYFYPHTVNAAEIIYNEAQSDLDSTRAYLL